MNGQIHIHEMIWKLSLKETRNLSKIRFWTSRKNDSPEILVCLYSIFWVTWRNKVLLIKHLIFGNYTKIRIKVSFKLKTGISHFIVLLIFSVYLFQDVGLYHIETSPLICSANQWTGFYIIGTSVMKEFKALLQK